MSAALPEVPVGDRRRTSRCHVVDEYGASDESGGATDIDVEVEPVLDLGDVRTGVRRLIPFMAARSADVTVWRARWRRVERTWQLVRSDGTFEIDAHYVLRTDGGALIEVRSIGIRRASAEVLERIAAGEPVDPGEYYFRTHIRPATADPTLAWMNDLLAVSSGERRQ